MAHSTRHPSGAKSPAEKSRYSRTTPKTKKPAVPPPAPHRHRSVDEEGPRSLLLLRHRPGCRPDRVHAGASEDLEAGRVPKPADGRPHHAAAHWSSVFLTHKTAPGADRRTGRAGPFDHVLRIRAKGCWLASARRSSWINCGLEAAAGLSAQIGARPGTPRALPPK